ncbi:MAG: hypothetical protein RMI53_02030 [Nitrososphaerota archaeon]|nr:hypothetical protein [Nitrososphaerota archaeon]
MVILIFLLIYGIFNTFLTIRVHNPSYNINQSYLEITVPIYLENRGFLPIDIVTNLIYLNTTIMEKSTIPTGASGIFPLKFLLKTDLLTKGVQVLATINIMIQPFLSTIISTNMSIPWEMPYEDFRMGEPTISIFNSTHILIKMPISFRNTSPFSIFGKLSIFVYDDGRIIGYGERIINVAPSIYYNTSIDLHIENPWIKNLKYLIEGTSRNYTISINLPGISINHTQIVNWPPIIGSPTIGKAILTPHNLTHSSIVIPLSFINYAPIPINGTIKGKFLDQGGNIIGELYDTRFNVQPKEFCSLNMTGHLKNIETKLRLILIMETPYGTIEGEIL